MSSIGSIEPEKIASTEAVPGAMPLTQLDTALGRHADADSSTTGVQTPSPAPSPFQGEGWGEVSDPSSLPSRESPGARDHAHGVRVARNVATTLITQLLTWALSFAVVLYLPAYLGPAAMGKLSFATSFGTILQAMITLGTSTVLIKEIARDRSHAASLLTTALMMRVPLGLVATVAAYGIALTMHLDRLEVDLVVICAIGTLFVIVNDAVISALQGLEMLPRQNAVAVIEKSIWAGLTIALVVLHGRLWQIAMVGWVSSSIAGICNLTAFSKDIRKMFRAGAERPPWLPDLRLVRSLIVMGLPFLGWSVCVTLYGQTDPIVLRFVTGRSLDIGWYSVTTKLVGTTLFLPSAINTALLPTLSRLMRENIDEFRALARRALSIVMLCGIPLAFVLGTMPDRVMSILPYGHKFAEAAPVLRIGGSGLLLWYLGITLGMIVIARDGQKRMFGAAVTAAVAGIPLCALLSHLTFVMYGNGAIGAITSDCMIELYLVVRYIRMLPGDAFDWNSLAYIGKCILAAAPMSVFLWFAVRAGAGLWVAAPCILIYGTMCWILRCIGPQELAMARRLAARNR